jgi:hypothetical protein
VAVALSATLPAPSSNISATFASSITAEVSATLPGPSVAAFFVAHGAPYAPPNNELRRWRLSSGRRRRV